MMSAKDFTKYSKLMAKIAIFFSDKITIARHDFLLD